MPIELNPGYQAQIQILDMQDPQHRVIYARDFNTPDELEGFIRTHAKSKEGWTALQGLAVPLRVSNDLEFAKSLLLPTFFHFASKIDSFAKKVFASFFAIVLDILTLPIRLVATPFRYYYNNNHPEQEHPIIPLLRERFGYEPITECIQIGYKEEKVVITNETYPPEGKKKKIEGSINIALKRLHGDIKSQSIEITDNSAYWLVDGEWDCHNHWNTRSNRYIFN